MKHRFLLCITVFLACHPLLWPQTLTNQFPPDKYDHRDDGAAPSASVPTAPSASVKGSRDEGRNTDYRAASFSADGVPIAQPLPAAPTGVPVHIAAKRQTKTGDLYTLDGDVEIDYRGYILRAGKATYDASTGLVEAEGKLRLEGGPDDESISADRGSVNLEQQTAHFYNVTGSIRLEHAARPTADLTSKQEQYLPGERTPPDPQTGPSNPLIFTGREVFKDGPHRYRVLDGSVTSCQLPRPDWRLVASRIFIDKDANGDGGGKAIARNTRFTLLQIPIVYLPYATHPIDSDGRQSGFLIPSFGVSTSKGTIFGEQYFWALSRSMDLTLGSEYYTQRGFAPRGEFRMRGSGLDFLDAHFHSLLDRRTQTATATSQSGNQGGTDLLVDGRHDFSPDTRGVLDLEYLSSYVFRQAFEENFSLAISSEVKSQAFLTHKSAGISESLRFDRYQSFETNTPLTEVRILHTPTLEAEAAGQRVPGTPLMGRFSASIGGLSRSEPGVQIGQVRRLDLYPHLEFPFSLKGWNFRPEIALRDTAYSKSQLPGTGLPVVRSSSLNRSDFEAGFEIHPPVVQRDFTPSWLVRLLGGDLRHTVEPDLQYRYVGGVHNFNSVLRFDETDIVSDTSEIEYSLTQRLFLRNLRKHPCSADEPATPSGMCSGGTIDWLSWRVTQKYFLHPDFGGAVVSGARNVLSSTLDLTGVAFLTQPRFLSPVVSRLRLRTTAATDLEWDLDYDAKLGRITSSDLFAAYRHNDYAFAISHAKLDAPELSPTSTANLAQAVSNYNQLRLLASYGGSGKRGLSAGANGGYDFTLSTLQFGGVQAAYNWNCCGISLEYRRYALGSVRNENQYLYSFSLAGIGTAGNLRRAIRIF
ncbi:MAG TPA: LPS assembly protein LptD [Acidisarcina sp.]